MMPLNLNQLQLYLERLVTTSQSVRNSSSSSRWFACLLPGLQQRRDNGGSPKRVPSFKLWMDTYTRRRHTLEHSFFLLLALR